MHSITKVSEERTAWEPTTRVLRPSSPACRWLLYAIDRPMRSSYRCSCAVVVVCLLCLCGVLC